MGPWRFLPLIASLLLAACHVPAGPDRAPDPAATAGLVHTPAPASNQTQAASGQATRRELYRVHLLLPEAGLRQGDNPLRLRLLSRHGQPLPGAVVRLEFWLPTEAHDGPRCQVEEVETGLYQVNGLRLAQAGDWMLTLTVSHGGREDWTVYQLPVAPPQLAVAPPAPAPPRPALAPAPAPAGKPVPAKAAAKTEGKSPAGPDLSTARTSDKGLFLVSYQSKPARPAVKQAATWRITIKARKGKKAGNVGDAVVNLSARPAQGAGQPGFGPLPAKSLGKGVYQAGGLKFAAPGLWLVVLDVNSRQGRDRVSFHLRLD